MKPILQQAASAQGANLQMLGAIAMQETDANPTKDSADGGWGLYQLTHQPGVSYVQAPDPAFAANYAAAMLARNGRKIASRHPLFSPQDQLLATAASYNLGPNKFSGDRSKIDDGSIPKGHYGHNVLALMKCFPSPW